MAVSEITYKPELIFTKGYQSKAVFSSWNVYKNPKKVNSGILQFFMLRYTKDGLARLGLVIYVHKMIYQFLSAKKFSLFCDKQLQETFFTLGSDNLTINQRDWFSVFLCSVKKHLSSSEKKNSFKTIICLLWESFSALSQLFSFFSSEMVNI